jgi:hypothetical protein
MASAVFSDHPSPKPSPLPCPLCLESLVAGAIRAIQSRLAVSRKPALHPANAFDRNGGIVDIRPGGLMANDAPAVASLDSPLDTMFSRDDHP